MQVGLIKVEIEKRIKMYICIKVSHTISVHVFVEKPVGLYEI